MRIGIISDIHGNVHALDTVLGDIASRHVDAVYCLGDLVGYAPFPNEVTERIRAEGIPTIVGNYDDGVGFDRDECGCAYRDPIERQLGDQSFAWTNAHVTAEHKAFLRTLVKEIRFNEYLFEDRPISSFQRLAVSSDADIIVFGHTHRPYTKLVDGVLFVNAGSVGRPKDGDWRARYALLEPTAAQPVTFVRLEYDVSTVAAAIRGSELPDHFASNIERGGAPVTAAG